MKDLVETDLDEELDGEVGANLVLGPDDETDIGVDQDLDEDVEFYEDESSACAPYLAHHVPLL